MRKLIVVALLALPACSQETASQNQLADYRPPVVQTRADLTARQQKRFDRLDKNADGVLMPDEYPGRRPERTAELDTNKDGKVSKSEFVEGAIARFDRLDANKDGQVTPEERPARRGGGDGGGDQ